MLKITIAQMNREDRTVRCQEGSTLGSVLQNVENIDLAGKSLVLDGSVVDSSLILNSNAEIFIQDNIVAG
jgi:hypothetical protein